MKSYHWSFMITNQTPQKHLHVIHATQLQHKCPPESYDVIMADLECVIKTVNAQAAATISIVLMRERERALHHRTPTRTEKHHNLN